MVIATATVQCGSAARGQGYRTMRVVGVDGCPGGWVGITWDTEAGTLTPVVYRSFAELVERTADAAAVGVDIPIGLHEGRPRGADGAARAFIGPRRSSVFPAPDRRLIGGGTYAELAARSRGLTGKGISQQAYAIYPKIAEVDAVMTPELQGRIVEVHPEVSFTALAGRPMKFAKKGPEGFAERRAALEAGLGLPIWDRAEARAVARPAGADDVLDAVVAAWSARRFAEGRSGSLPESPERDGRGLRVEIVY